MASPTTNKGYQYAAHAGSVGSWDTQLNGNIEYQDLNLGGYYSITASSSITVANTFNSTFATIASTAQSITMSASLAQNLFYNILGTLQSSLTINMPAAGSIYTFGNNLTTGTSYAVVAQPIGGSGVTLTSGGQEILVFTSSQANPAQNTFGAITAQSVTTSSGITATGPITQNSSQYGAMASGDTASRPAATASYFRYNTTLGQPEWSDGVSWYPIGAQPIAAGFKNLRITNGATPNSQISLAADAVTVETTSGTAYRLLTVAFTIDCTITGANGLDAGGLANNTWYSVWVIYNPTTATTAGLASTSATAPAMPAGYIAKARLGWFRTDASAHFHRLLQLGKRAQYVVTAGSPTVKLPNINTGAVGTFSNTAPVWGTVFITSVVPTTASTIWLVLTDAYNNATAATGMYAAPNSAYAGRASTNPPPVGLGDASTRTDAIVPAAIMLESTVLSIIANQAGGGFLCLGWEDNI